MTVAKSVTLHRTEIPNDLFWKYPTTGDSKKDFLGNLENVGASLRVDFSKFLDDEGITWVQRVAYGEKTRFHFKTKADMVKFQMKYL